MVLTFCTYPTSLTAERQAREYLVAWEGYGEDSNSWEPIQNLESVIDLVEVSHCPFALLRDVFGAHGLLVARGPQEFNEQHGVGTPRKRARTPQAAASAAGEVKHPATVTPGDGTDELGATAARRSLDIDTQAAQHNRKRAPRTRQVSDGNGDDELFATVIADENDTLADLAEPWGVTAAAAFELNAPRIPGLRVNSKFRQGTAVLLPKTLEIEATPDTDTVSDATTAAAAATGHDTAMVLDADVDGRSTTTPELSVPHHPAADHPAEMTEVIEVMDDEEDGEESQDEWIVLEDGGTDHPDGCDCGGGKCKLKPIWACSYCAEHGPYSMTYAEAVRCEEQHEAEAATVGLPVPTQAAGPQEAPAPSAPPIAVGIQEAHASKSADDSQPRAVEELSAVADKDSHEGGRVSTTEAGALADFGPPTLDPALAVSMPVAVPATSEPSGLSNAEGAADPSAELTISSPGAVAAIHHPAQAEMIDVVASDGEGENEWVELVEPEACHPDGCSCGGYPGKCKLSRIWSCEICSPTGPFNATYVEADACERAHAALVANNNTGIIVNLRTSTRTGNGDPPTDPTGTPASMMLDLTQTESRGSSTDPQSPPTHRLPGTVAIVHPGQDGEFESTSHPAEGKSHLQDRQVGGSLSPTSDITHPPDCECGAPLRCKLQKVWACSGCAPEDYVLTYAEAVACLTRHAEEQAAAAAGGGLSQPRSQHLPPGRRRSRSSFRCFLRRWAISRQGRVCSGSSALKRIGTLLAASVVGQNGASSCGCGAALAALIIATT